MENKNFSIFLQEYEKLFEENLRAFCRNIKNFGKEQYLTKQYNLFFPSCGNTVKDKIKFIIYGQATNKWQPAFRIQNQINFQKLIFAAKVYSNVPDPGEICPLDWVNKDYGKYKLYNFFWPVTYMLVNSFNKTKIKISNDNYLEEWLNDHEWCKSMA